MEKVEMMDFKTDNISLLKGKHKKTAIINSNGQITDDFWNSITSPLLASIMQGLVHIYPVKTDS